MHYTLHWKDPKPQMQPKTIVYYQTKDILQNHNLHSIIAISFYYHSFFNYGSYVIEKIIAPTFYLTSIDIKLSFEKLKHYVIW